MSPTTYSHNWFDVGENKPKLLFSIGLPRSGKSTLINSWLMNARPGEPRVVISGDDFRWILTGDVYHRPAEPQVWSMITTCIRVFLKNNYTVFFDETNTSEWSLTKIFEMDKNAAYVMVRTEPRICIERAYNTHPYPEVLEKVIRKLTENLENLTEEKVEEIRYNVIEHEAYFKSRLEKSSSPS